MAPDSIGARLEPGTGELAQQTRSPVDAGATAQLSIAISLKRIADALESTLTKGEIAEIYGTAIRTSETTGRG